jgi:DNA-binding Lrp family transcriptional regulator
MDELDLLIIQNLMRNSRATYRKLAGITKLSVSGIHKRINKFIENGDIREFLALPSMVALKYLRVVIFGTSNAISMDSIMDELALHENIFTVNLAGGKFLYIHAFLRDITELQDFSSYVSKAAHIDDPTVGILNRSYITAPEPLTPIDYKIIKSLNKDARKPVADIADEVGISAKTARKRLNRMIENKLITFSIVWTPTSESVFMTFFHIYLRQDDDITYKTKYIREKYSKNVISCRSYSNIPKFILMLAWTRTPYESRLLQRDLEKEGFKDIVPRVGLDARMTDTWVDQLLKTK